MFDISLKTFTNYRTGKDEQLYWPNADYKPASSYRALVKNITDMDLTIKRCKYRRTCVQAGGHVGLWPRRLSHSFERVISFEPIPEFYACMKLNGLPTNVQFYEAALSDHDSKRLFYVYPTMGSSRFNISKGDPITVETVTIDDIQLEMLDALFLDVEGHEAEALQGGRQTILKFKPVIHVEMLPFARESITKKLVEFGYHFMKKIHHDEIWLPN